MKRNVITISVFLILMMILSLSAVTVMATVSETESLPNEQTSSEVVSSENASSETVSSDSSSSVSSDEQQVSSEESTGSQEQPSSEEQPSSKPKPSRPSGGTFIDETGSVVSTTQSQTDDSVDQTPYEDEQLGVEEEIEFYEGGEVVYMSSLVTRYIWIPVLISVLCIASLIYVNVAFKLKFAKSSVSTNNRARRRKPQKNSANRRRVK